MEMLLVFFSVAAGLVIGAILEARRWREKGDHEYMNRMESRGRLYTVRREREGG